jgi:hypothetical protein
MFAASIIRAGMMMEVAITSETSVNIYQTALHNNPDVSHLHTRRRENLKSHTAKMSILRPDLSYNKLHSNNEISYPLLQFSVHNPMFLRAD